MKYLVKSMILGLGLLICPGCELFDSSSPNTLTESEIIAGLKEALDIGLTNSVTSASSLNGYLQNEAIKILLPQEVQELQTKIQTESIDLVITSVSLQTIYNLYITEQNDGMIILRSWLLR